MKDLGKTVGIVVNIDEDFEELVKVYWGEYGTFWVRSNLLKILTDKEIIAAQSPI